MYVKRPSKGTVISEADLTMLRPCPDDAIQPFEVNKLVGRVLLRDAKGRELKMGRRKLMVTI